MPSAEACLPSSPFRLPGGQAARGGWTLKPGVSSHSPKCPTASLHVVAVQTSSRVSWCESGERLPALISLILEGTRTTRRQLQPLPDFC